MSILTRLGGRAAVTAGIVETFRTLSRHPHKSRCEAATGGDFMEYLRGLGLSPVRDGAGNLTADVPASPGREGAPLLILQGHMDMVCAVAPGSGFDPLTDPVTIRVADGVLRSDGRSSLGADNNLGNAAVLWLLSTGKVSHGPLRLLFTVGEELGLAGAKQVDPAWLAGAAYLLNTDGFYLGRAIVGSAGGRRENWTRPVETEPAPDLPAWRVSLSGGLGGHSGEDINKGRANPIKLLSAYLAGLPGGRVAALSGGTTHNAIPAAAQAVVLAPAEPDLTALRDTLRGDYAGADPNLAAACAPAPRPERVWTPGFQAHALAFLNGVYHGVYAMDPAFPGVVGASANLGAAAVEGAEFQVRTFIRAAQDSLRDELAARHQALAEAHGFQGTASAYPGWPGDRNNPLARLMDRVYREACGRALDINAVHAGLEPSVFRAKAPGLVMVSTGPDILDAHSVDERAPLAGLPDYAALLAGTMEAL